MNLQELLEKLDAICPFRYQEDFDNSGLQVGNPATPCKRILLAFDFTIEVLKEAIEKKADAIITHHPFLFQGLKTINANDFEGKAIYELIEHNIGLIALHTNLDKVDYGVNMQLGKDLGLENLNVFLPEEENVGLGATGILKTPIPFEDFALQVKATLQRPAIKYAGDTKKIVSKIAVMGGAGGEFLTTAKEIGADVYISSDFKYHDAQKAENTGMCIIDSGHFGTEVGVVKALAEKLREQLPLTDIVVSGVMRDFWAYK